MSRAHLILVVEDDPTLRLTTQKQLAALGYQSESVASGEEAVERSHSGFDLILMDIGLPGIDGRHATLLIREKELNEKRKRIPIIALTAHSDRQTTMLAGMDDLLQKPALMADIQRVLDKWLPHDDDHNGLTSPTGA